MDIYPNVLVLDRRHVDKTKTLREIEGPDLIRLFNASFSLIALMNFVIIMDTETGEYRFLKSREGMDPIEIFNTVTNPIELFVNRPENYKNK